MTNGNVAYQVIPRAFRLLLLLLLGLSLGASAAHDVFKIPLNKGAVVIDTSRLPCNPAMRSKNGFTAWGIWTFKHDVAEFGCGPGQRVDFVSLERISTKPFSQVILGKVERHIKTDGKFDYYKRRLPKADGYEIVTFVGADGNQVVVRRSITSRSSYRAFRKLSDQIEISYLVKLSIETDEVLFDNDRKILNFVKSIVRTE